MPNPKPPPDNDPDGRIDDVNVPLGEPESVPLGEPVNEPGDEILDNPPDPLEPSEEREVPGRPYEDGWGAACKGAGVGADVKRPSSLNGGEGEGSSQYFLLKKGSMTAEVGILNKHGVALAADSAITIGQGEKIFVSANKIFTLSKYQPVGIMIYGSASLHDVPWEIIIKAYRKRLGDIQFDRLEDYCTHFITFLENTANCARNDIRS
jgi:hypothetical protein